MGDPSNSLLALVSALTQTFAVVSNPARFLGLKLISALILGNPPQILLGYLFGRLDVVPTSAASGIGQLVAKVALPSLLFRSIATTDLESVNLGVVLCVSFSKLIILAFSALVGYLMHRKERNRISVAGIFGLFATNSNDLAIGLPLSMALYPLDRFPQNFPGYIYVFAVIQNVLINPICFVMLEVGNSSSSGRSVRHVLTKVV